jgi:hypothetical protein
MALFLSTFSPGRRNILPGHRTNQLFHEIKFLSPVRNWYILTTGVEVIELILEENDSRV